MSYWIYIAVVGIAALIGFILRLGGLHSQQEEVRNPAERIAEIERSVEE